jgi:flagellar protein FlaJ
VRRNRSRGLRRAISQILRALRTGGRVSDVIANIADDVAFETRMRIRDFTETLNLVSIVYIMVAVVAPVALTILSAVVQLPLLAGFIPPEYIMAAFGGILMSMGLMLFVTIRLEPGT